MCLVFQSMEQGVGKNLLWEWIGKVIGHLFWCLSKTMGTLLGKFNAHQASKLLHVLDEVTHYGGVSNSEIDQLKALLTSTELMIEAKFKDIFRLAHFTRYVMLTNNTWVVPVSNGDRRLRSSKPLPNALHNITWI